MSTEPTTDPKETETPTQVTETPQELQEQATEDITDLSPAKPTRAEGEAAKYRRKARDVQALLDDTTGRYEALQRSVVEDAARGEGITAPEAIWKLGFDLNTITTDTGGMDHAATVAAVREFAQSNGLHVKPRLDPVPGAGTGSNTPETGWANAF